jgi:heme-degrading monooxygenase HmoA
MKAYRNKTKQLPIKKHQDSVFKEAWGNMNSDMAKVMPGFLSKRLQSRKGKIWVVVVITFVELVVFALIGKFVYDWFVK